MNLFAQATQRATGPGHLHVIHALKTMNDYIYQPRLWNPRLSNGHKNINDFGWVLDRRLAGSL